MPTEPQQGVPCHAGRTSTMPNQLLRAMFDAAVAAALPARIVPGHLPAPPKGRTIVLGAGKASAAMARAVEDHWPGPLEGLVVTRYGHGVPCARIEIVEAAHPVPDAAGQAAAARILELARERRPGRSGLVPDLRRRLVPADAAGRGLDAGGQAGGQPGAAGQWRRYRADEHGPPPSLGDQGRPARGRGAPGQGGEPADLRRARRRPGGDRLGADHRRPQHLRRCPGRARALPHRAAGSRPPPPGRGPRGDAQARRSAAGRGRERA